MLRTRMMVVLGLLVSVSMILSACGGSTTPTTAPQTQAPQVQPTTAPTQAPTEPPTPTTVPVTRKGPWVDELDFSEQGDNAVCISQIQAGDIDTCADGNTNKSDRSHVVL